MFQRRIGDLLDFTGPFGAFTLERVPDRELVFVAEGAAIAPIRPMLRRALSSSVNRINLLYAAHTPEHLLYRQELESLASAHPQFKFERLVAAPASLYQQLVDEVQRRWVVGDGDRSRHFFVCGIGSGVLKLRDVLRHAGYERRAVRYEQW